MQQIRTAIASMIATNDGELNTLLARAQTRLFPRKTTLNNPNKIPDEVYFINKGLLQVLICDRTGMEHTIHFSYENQFIADYSSFIMQAPANYLLRTIEETEVVILPRASVEWGYANMKEGNKLGRMIAEYYMVYKDARIAKLYELSPKEMYDTLTDTFPDIHNRAPQHMIASYLGITPVHLSRLKKAAIKT